MVQSSTKASITECCIMNKRMNRFNRGARHRSFISHALHHGREFLHGTDHFFRHYGPAMKQLAMVAAPALASSNPAAAAAVAAVGQAADGCSQLRSHLG